MIFYTNAPEAFDYHYVKTVKTYRKKPGQTFEWRQVEVDTDHVPTFEAYQKPRYASGLYSTLQAGDTAEIRMWVERFGLPADALDLQ